jgi:hypothetical protein
MSNEEQHKWYDAMDAELKALHERDCFEVVSISEAQGRQVVPCTWALRKKRLPDGSLLKYKARLCLRGDQMHEVDQEDGYSPVVDWATIRMMLTISVKYSLHATQVDFNNAFVQAPLKEPMYMSLPPGFDKDTGQCLKLTKSLYGHKHAAKLFYQLLRDTLTKKLNFHLSESDHCLFIRHDCIIINWVDDQLILTKDPKVALEVVESMRSAGLILDIESQQGSIANYLGIQIQEQDDGTLLLTQSGLVERVLEAMDLEDANPKDTPASEALGSNKDSPTFDGKYNYRSVIGMIMYLTSSTRPDCAFAIHQCARFSHDPRQAHASALKRLACYLKKTKLDGLRIKPHRFGDPARLDLWVDADFAGIWGKDDPQDPSTVRSRSGILVTYDDTSVFWSSKLQTEIALSTMEAEYIALSAGMRILIHLRRIHEDVCTHFKGCEIPYDPQSNISHVFEDNHACFVLATTDPPRMTPRSKSIAIKYHWFREHLKEGEIEMRTTKSEDQRANILTKALPRPQFETERHLIMGF